MTGKGRPEARKEYDVNRDKISEEKKTGGNAMQGKTAEASSAQLTLDDLDSVAGGAGGIKLRPRLNVKLTLRCPHCNSTNIPINPPEFYEQEEIRPFLESTMAKCYNCGKSGSAASFYDFADEFKRTMGL